MNAKTLFNTLAGNNRKVRIQEVTESQPDPEALLAVALAGWAKDAPEEFTAWLEEESQKAHDLARQTVSDHAKLSFNLGVEEGLKFIQQKFETWAGQG